MSISKLLARASAVALFASFLTACGGGGGGGGGDGSPGGSSGAADNLAIVDRTNARQFAAGYRDVLNVATEAVYYSPLLINELIGIARSSAEESLDCGYSGSVKLSSSINSAGIGTLTLQYNNCTEQDFYFGYHYRYSGTIRITTRAFNGYASAFDYHYDNYKFDNLQAGMSNSYSGDFSVDPDAGGVRFAANVTMTNSRTQQTTKTVNYVAVFNGSEMPIQANGRIELSGLGSITVAAAESAHTYLSGRQGILRLDSDPYSGNYTVHLALDINGDNAAESFSWIPWYALDYQAETNTAPTVAVSHPGLQLQASQHVTIPINGVSDTEYDLLSYSIQTVQSPGNIDLQLALQEDQSFTFRTGTHGDYIIALTVDDGRGGVTTQNITFHVSLAAPMVQSPSNVQVINGSLVNASLQPSNPEAGPFTYQIVSGPAGMTVDSQGTLHWQSTSTFFERAEMKIVAKVSNADHDITIPVTFPIEDSGRASPIVRSGAWGSNRDKNTYALDFENDGTSRILLTDGNDLIHTLKFQGGQYVQDWVYPYSVTDGGIIERILPFDADHDGDYEIAVQIGGKIRIINETHDAIARSVDLGALNVFGVQAADIDNDGNVELIVVAATDYFSTSQQAIVVDALTLNEKWRTPSLALGNDFAIGNVDNDSALELVFSGGYVYDGATHNNEWAYGVRFGSMVVTGDVDGDGIEEIVAVDANQYQGYPTAYSAVSKTLLWNINADPLTCSIALVQLDNDSAKEVVTSGCTFGSLRAFDATAVNATQKWVSPQMRDIKNIVAGDIDNDGDADLVFVSTDPFGSSKSQPVVLDADTQVVQFDGTSTGEGNFTGAISGSVSGNRQILFSTRSKAGGQEGVFFNAVDPLTAAIVPSPVIVGTPSQSPAFCMADYDGDGSDDILFSSVESYSTPFMESYNLVSQTQQWKKTSSSFSSTPYAIACGDFNNDGHVDVASYSYGNNTTAIDDAFNQTLLWSTNDSATNMATGDTDGDGSIELYVTTTSGLKKYVQSGNTYVQSGSFLVGSSSWFFGPAPLVSLTDIDGDGKPDIVLAVQDDGWITGHTTNRLIVLNSDLSERSTSTFEGFIIAIAPERIANGQILATIAEDSSLYSSTPAKYRAALIDVASGQWIWRSPQLLGTALPNSLHYDTAAPNGGSLSIGTSAAMYITR